MATNTFKNQLLAISQRDERWETMAKERIGNEKRHRRGFQVAAKVLFHLRENNLTKAWLADQMGVTAQRVGVILKGRSNMTLETITRLEDATGLELLAVPQSTPVRKKTESRRKTVFDGLLESLTPYTTVTPISERGVCASF